MSIAKITLINSSSDNHISYHEIQAGDPAIVLNEFSPRILAVHISQLETPSV